MALPSASRTRKDLLKSEDDLNFIAVRGKASDAIQDRSADVYYAPDLYTYHNERESVMITGNGSTTQLLYYYCAFWSRPLAKLKSIGFPRCLRTTIISASALDHSHTRFKIRRNPLDAQ